MQELPELIGSEDELETVLAQPYPELVDMMRRLDGDILILGAAGKMGPSLAHVAVNACRAAGVKKRVIAVSRFLEPGQREKMESWGVETIVCDLANVEDMARLPKVKNVIFMVGRKFGVAGSEHDTWVTNTVIAGNAAATFRESNIVAFSTGCVYPLVSPQTGGSVETDATIPVGEYGNSCLGRERVFQYFSARYGTHVLLFRLNYAIDMRYGVLLDIAQAVFSGEPVDMSVSTANVIWQGDANNRALLCLEHTANPPAALNVTGPELLYVKDLAAQFAKIFGVTVRFKGNNSGIAYLSNAARSIALFGPPRVSVEQMVQWIANWVRLGGRTLGKPTHFQVTDGQFLAKPADG